MTRAARKKEINNESKKERKKKRKKERKKGRKKERKQPQQNQPQGHFAVGFCRANEESGIPLAMSVVLCLKQTVDNGGRCDLRVSFVLSVVRFFSRTFDGVINKNTLSRVA